MFQDDLSRSAGPDIAAADARYLAQDWTGALAHYAAIERQDPERARRFSLPLLTSHCRIELAPTGAAPEGAAAPSPSPREQAVIEVTRARAAQLCRTGEPDRAARLLRMLAGYDSAIAEPYRYGLAPGRSAITQTPPEPRTPGFIAALGIDALSPAALKAQHHGKRVLLIYHRFTADGNNRQTDAVRGLSASATRFGLDLRVFQFAGPDATALPATLLHETLGFRPDVIIFDHHYTAELSAATREQVAGVLGMARRMIGARVVVSFMDPWIPMLISPTAIYHGLGQIYDLVHHFHPEALLSATPEQAAASFCYMLPTQDLPTPTAAPQTIPRACFVGTITWFNVARLAWWAETKARDLPIDVIESGGTLSQLAYYNIFAQHQLVLNLTARPGGSRIVTGRPFEVMRLGGVLLEEHSPNIAFFFSPGVHYVPFETIDDLAAVVPAVLADAERRAAIRTAGQQWATTYFSGDYFWAGLLQRLFG